MRVLVTGGAGFIGANLCRELAAAPASTDVIALDDLSTGSADNLSGVAAEFVKGSILDRRLLDGTVETADAVIHLAALPSVPRSWLDPLRTHEVNATGTVYVLEACRRRSLYVVAASSSSVYGSVSVSPKHEDLPTRPLSPYAMSKIASEAGVLAYGAAYGLPTLALRFLMCTVRCSPPAIHTRRSFRHSSRRCSRVNHADRRRWAPGAGLHVRHHRDHRPGRRRARPSDQPRPGQPGVRHPGFGKGAGRSRSHRYRGTPADMPTGRSAPGDVRDSQADPSASGCCFPMLGRSTSTRA